MEAVGVAQPGDDNSSRKILLEPFNTYRGLYKKDGAEFLVGLVTVGQMGNGFKLEEGRFGPGARKNSLTVRAVKPWNWFPR